MVKLSTFCFIAVHEANLEENVISFKGFPWTIRLRYIMEYAKDLAEARYVHMQCVTCLTPIAPLVIGLPLVCSPLHSTPLYPAPPRLTPPRPTSLHPAPPHSTPPRPAHVRALWEATNNTVGFNHMVASGSDATSFAKRTSKGPVAYALETMYMHTAYFADDDPR